MARKQSKTSWRKRGAPLADAALEVRRSANQDRRTGGSVSALADAELFSIGAAPDERPPRARKQQKVLHVDRVVAPNPNISVVTADRTAPSKAGLAPQLRSKLSKLRGAVSHAQPPPAAASTSLDVWGAAGAAAPSALTAAAQRRRALRDVAPEASTVSAAVAVAPEGASWNPDEAARQQLVTQAISHEVERLRKERRGRSRAFTHAADSDDEDGAAGAVAAVEAPIDRTPRDFTLVGGEVDTREEEEEGEEEDDDEGARAAARAPKEKLTAAQRNKRKLAKEREKAAAEAKRQRRAEKQLGREGALLSEIKKEDKALLAKRQQEAEHEARRIKKLGKIKYEPKRPEVLLSDEVPESLRQLPPATGAQSLLSERYDSMQARNLIEVRQSQPKKRKTNRKQVARESCKDVRYTSPYYKGEMPAWL